MHNSAQSPKPLSMSDTDQTSQTEHWCNECLDFKPVGEFAIKSKTTGELSDVCRTCKADADRERHQRQRAEERKKATMADMRAIRRTRSIDQLCKVCEQVAERLGGWPKVVEDWSRQATDKNCTDNQRLAVLKDILELKQRIADHETGQVSELSPDEALAQWHERGQLVPRLRAMLADGRLSLDDIDPAPSDHLAE